MGRVSEKKVGLLSKDEKIYIAEHFLWYDNEWIAKKLKRSISYINTYVDRLNHKDKKDKKESEEKQEVKKDIEKTFENKNAATVMTQESSAIPYRTKKYESPFRTR